MIETIRTEVLGYAQDILSNSAYPFFDKIGENSFLFYIRDHDEYFNPLLVFAVKAEGDKHIVSIYFKKDTEGLDTKIPYKKKDFDCVREIQHTNFGFQNALFREIMQIAPFCAP